MADGDAAGGRTDARDYEVLTGAFGTALALVAAGAQARRGAAARLATADLPATALATFGIARILVHDQVTSWLRRPFVAEDGDGQTPRGTHLRAALGELLSCTRCAGVWVALGLTGLRLAAPSAGRAVTGLFAAAAVNDLLQAVFADVRVQATLRERDLRQAA